MLLDVMIEKTPANEQETIRRPERGPREFLLVSATLAWHQSILENFHWLILLSFAPIHEIKPFRRAEAHTPLGQRLHLSSFIPSFVYVRDDV